MLISDIITHLESIAPPFYQESYDNAGLLTGQPGWECKGVLVTLEATEAVIREAMEKKCNCVVAHHPIVFGGLKKINGKNYVERAVIAAIKNDIAIYAIHTNLDNMMAGVNGRMADKLGLVNRQILLPRPSSLSKLFTFVPATHIDPVRDALFAAGGGIIGNYGECSFASDGTGSFRAGEGAHPFAGKIGERHYEKELKLEIIFPSHLQAVLVQALIAAHPYEEVAYGVVQLANTHPGIGAGLAGELEQPMEEKQFLDLLKKSFQAPVVRHTALLRKPIKKVALCGGAGSFLISRALGFGADIFVTADIKYHEFFDASDRMVIADIGHFESEQFTVDLLADILREKFPTFAVLKSGIPTNPVCYHY